MYKSEIGKPFYYALKVLDYTYNIPNYSGESCFWPKYILMKFMCFVVMIPTLLHLIMSNRNGIGLRASEDISVLLGCTGAFISLFQFAVHYRKWVEFLSDIMVFNNYREVYKFEKRIRYFNILTFVFFTFNIFGVILYGVTQLMNGPACKHMNEEKGLREICYSFIPIWLPFDVKDVATTITIFSTQMILFGFLITPGAVIPALTLECTELLIVHTNILKEHFISLFENPGEISDKLSFCIKYHSRILSLGDRLNVIMKESNGHFSLIGAIIIGALLNQMMRTKSPAGVTYVLGYLTILFLCCHAGQRIKDESSSIADSIYASNWYKADAQTMKDLAFIILRCQTPIEYDALPLGVLDYALFVMITKTAYSFLGLLSQRI